jgi:hypothetical protein
MNAELQLGANRLPFYFFILHSYFFICFPWPPSRPLSPSDSRQSAAVQTAQRLSTKPDHCMRLTKHVSFDLSDGASHILQTGLSEPTRNCDRCQFVDRHLVGEFFIFMPS